MDDIPKFAICKLSSISLFGHLSWPIYQDQLKLVIKSHAFICITKNNNRKIPECMIPPWLRTGRLTKWNLICVTSMHTAKGTRQVPKWRDMFMNSCKKIFCCMLPQNALTSQPKHEKAASPKSSGGGLT